MKLDKKTLEKLFCEVKELGEDWDLALMATMLASKITHTVHTFINMDLKDKNPNDKFSIFISAYKIAYIGIYMAFTADKTIEDCITNYLEDTKIFYDVLISPKTIELLKSFKNSLDKNIPKETIQ